MSREWRPWTADDDAWLTRQWVRQEMTYSDLGEALRRTVRAVQERAQELGLEARPRRTPSGFVWSEEVIETAKRLRAEGFSSSQIAKAIGAPSRNAVVGKMHRLNVPMLPKPSKPARPPKAPRVSASKRVKPMKAPVLSVVAPQSPVLPGANPKTLAELERAPFYSCCRWPVGDDPGPGNGDRQLFCADAVEEASPYCPAHSKRAWAKTRSKEQKAADAERSRKMKELHGHKIGFGFRPEKAA